MHFAVVGPGRVGSALITDLTAAGFTLVGIVTKGTSNTGDGHCHVGECVTGTLADVWPTVASRADVVFVSVPDSEIASVAGQMASLPVAAPRRPATVFHCSGALAGTVLAPLQRKGWDVGSLHPIQSVTGVRAGQLTNISWGMEGDGTALAVAERVVAALRGTGLIVPADLKPTYHAAAVMASNYIVALAGVAAEMLSTVGISTDEALHSLLPLMDGALRNMKEAGVPQALTGPIERGDAATVEAHRHALSNNEETAHIWPLYELLGMAAVQMALKKKSIDQSMTKALQAALGCGSNE